MPRIINLFVFISMLCLTLAGCGTMQHSAGFPEPVREHIEWARVWMPDSDAHEKPRVLLIGDSIVVGYFSGVETRLEDRAYCGYLATSRSVCDPVFFDELRLVLNLHDYAAIQFNNGLHGWGYSEDDYRQGVERFVDELKRLAPDAELIWAHSTPHNLGDTREALTGKNARIAHRNQIAADIMREQGIPVNDLFTLCYGKPGLYSSDTVHFQNEGKELQAKQTAEMIQGRMME